MHTLSFIQADLNEFNMEIHQINTDYEQTGSLNDKFLEWGEA